MSPPPPPPRPDRGLRDDEVAGALERVADLLEVQQASHHRVRAFRAAATTLRGLDEPSAALLAREGRRGLEGLPTIGKSIAAAIEELHHTGSLGLLERLEGEVSSEELLTTVPSIGAELAHRIHEALGVETLEELELAAHDGRLAGVPGFGERRVRAVRDSLAATLGRASRRRARRAALGDRAHGDETHEATPLPSVALLLGVDARYRAAAEAGRLPRIAPRRFNPGAEAWLPILHGDAEGWHFHAMFSNTARAHQLGRTRDWVVIYLDHDGEETQATVVTEHGGALAGERVVRGRERECEAWYEGGGRPPPGRASP